MKTDNASFPRGIIEALFIDEAATAIRIAHYNKDVGEEDRELIQDVVQVDPESPMFQDLMKLTNLEEIDEDTIEHTKNRIDEWKQFEAFQKSASEEPSIEVPIKIDESDWRLDNILDTLTTNFTKEDLFAYATAMIRKLEKLNNLSKKFSFELTSSLKDEKNPSKTGGSTTKDFCSTQTKGMV